MAGGTHLELEERERLAALKAEGLSLRAIARQLGRAASTVSRELRRNALPKGGYLPVHAEGRYRERRQRQAVLERDERLGRFVRERLLEGWTPERVAGRVRGGAGSAGSVECRSGRSTPSSTAPGREGRSSGGCCRAGAPGAAAAGPGGRVPPPPGGARSTTGPRPSRRARAPGTGGATS